MGNNSRDNRDLNVGNGGQNAEKEVALGHIWEVQAAGLETKEIKPSGAQEWSQRNRDVREHHNPIYTKTTLQGRVQTLRAKARAAGRQKHAPRPAFLYCSSAQVLLFREIMATESRQGRAPRFSRGLRPVVCSPNPRVLAQGWPTSGTQ